MRCRGDLKTCDLSPIVCTARGGRRLSTGPEPERVMVAICAHDVVVVTGGIVCPRQVASPHYPRPHKKTRTNNFLKRTSLPRVGHHCALAFDAYDPRPEQ